MQKLNAREYFVAVIIGIVTLVNAVLLGRELFSMNSPFAMNTEGQGEFISVQVRYVISVAQTALQMVLSIFAFIYLLKKRRTGWICSFALLALYAFISSYVVGNAFLAGFRDILVMIGAILCLLFLLALIFLCIPSTLKKFKIGKSAIVPVVLLLGVLVSFYFFIPE